MENKRDKKETEIKIIETGHSKKLYVYFIFNLLAPMGERIRES